MTTRTSLRSSITDENANLPTALGNKPRSFGTVLAGTTAGGLGGRTFGSLASGTTTAAVAPTATAGIPTRRSALGDVSGPAAVDTFQQPARAKRATVRSSTLSTTTTTASTAAIAQPFSFRPTAAARPSVALGVRAGSPTLIGAEDPTPMDGVVALGPSAAARPSIVPQGTPAVKDIPFEDIDEADLADTQACAEYAEDIMKHMRSMELEYMPNTDFLTPQPEVTEKMRRILLGWLLQTQSQFKLMMETYYLTVNIIDRFLSCNKVSRRQLQLLGATAMFVAAKYEEVRPPLMKDFRYISENAFSRKDMLHMESLILSSLKFKLVPPYPLYFLRRFSKAACVDARTHTTAKYLLELASIDYALVRYLPSTQAAAALWLALHINRTGEWTTTMQHYSQYTEAQLEPLVRRLAALHQNERTRTGYVDTVKRYASADVYAVSSLPLPANLIA